MAPSTPYGEFVGKKIVLTRNLDQPNDKGELAEEIEGTLEAANDQGILFKPKGKVKPDRWPKVIRATEQLSRAQLFIDDSSDLGVMELRAKCRRLHSRHDLGLIIVDYLQLMRPDDTSISRVEQIGHMSRGLKILARELNVPVIALSQLSRGVESRTDKRPMLSDLRESGQIEQDADLVMFIYRDEYYFPETTDKPGEAELIIAKHRNGALGNVHLTFQNEYPRFLGLQRAA